jgi:Holliday junction resolvasome RuvABC endonuclease subunit
MKILSLDISSAAIGWALIDFENNNLLDYGVIHPPKKEKDFLKKLHKTKELFLELLQKTKPDKIVIEEISKFMPHKSSAGTIITLAVYNRTLALTALEYNGLVPEYMSVLTIRHKLKKNKVLPKKEDMPKLIEKHLKIKFPWILKKSGEICKTSYDLADGIAVGLAWIQKVKYDTLK